MKVIPTLFLCIGIFLSAAGASDATELKTEKDKVSYSIGLSIGNNFKGQSVDINTDVFMKGIKDGLSGSKPLMTEKEVQETMTVFQRERAKALAEKNKKEEETFLAQNKKKDGVKTLPSGLQYKIIKAGDGKKPKATDTVTVHYRGTLIDGTEFDSSYKRGEPTSFPVNGVISGWTEALQLMTAGSKWQLFIPSKLAYGERGAGQQIGPNAMLIFEVELLSVDQ